MEVLSTPLGSTARSDRVSFSILHQISALPLLLAFLFFLLRTVQVYLVLPFRAGSAAAFYLSSLPALAAHLLHHHSFVLWLLLFAALLLGRGV